MAVGAAPNEQGGVTPQEEQIIPISMETYLERFKRQSLWLVIGGQAAIIFVIAIIAVLTRQYEVWTWVFWGMVGVSFFVGIGIHYLIIIYMSRPAIDLIKAVVHVAGKQNDTTPPNPNTARYSHNGFREILQTIYELATVVQPTTTPTSEIGAILSEGISASATGVIILNHEREVIYHNDKAPTVLNTKDQIVPELLFSEDSTLNKWLDRCEKRAVHAEYTWYRVPNKPAGEPGRKIFDVTASYQKDSKAETILTLFDRTETYTPEEEDMDFIAFAAHELRGPITVIRGYLDVLDDELKPVLENDQAELLGRLIVSSNRLSSYVSNILNASRYDRRHLKFHLTEQHLDVAYDLIKDDMQLRAAAQNRLLLVNLPEDLPTVAIDTTSMSEVLSNLIDNAIKYSNEGGQVLVTAKEAGNFVQVSVEDHGIGMPGNVIGNLFHKFYRSHRSRETVAGTGIGLYISKAIVESHGGVIDVRSIENKGSTFTFTVPIYASVADKLKANNGSNEKLIGHGSGWIRNHSMFRG